MRRTQQVSNSVMTPQKSSGSSFLDDWLSKRQQLSQNMPRQQATEVSQPSDVEKTTNVVSGKLETTQADSQSANATEEANLRLKGDDKNDDSEVAVKLR